MQRLRFPAPKPLHIETFSFDSRSFLPKTETLSYFLGVAPPGAPKNEKTTGSHQTGGHFSILEELGRLK